MTTKLTETAPNYLRTITLKTSKVLDESLVLNIFKVNGRNVANIHLEHSEVISHPLIGVPLEDIVKLGKRLEKYT